jgi:hypothetical protein
VIQGWALKRLANMTCVRPLMVSLSAGADPSWVSPGISTWALSLNSSAAKCGAVPSPAEA